MPRPESVIVKGVTVRVGDQVTGHRQELKNIRTNDPQWRTVAFSGRVRLLGEAEEHKEHKPSGFYIQLEDMSTMWVHNVNDIKVI